MGNLIAVFVLAAIVGFAAGYVYRKKKKGAKCIGCPYAESCASKKGSCTCGSAEML